MPVMTKAHAKALWSEKALPRLWRWSLAFSCLLFIPGVYTFAYHASGRFPGEPYLDYDRDGIAEGAGLVASGFSLAYLTRRPPAPRREKDDGR